jgi:hypothetical protein
MGSVNINATVAPTGRTKPTNEKPITSNAIQHRAASTELVSTHTNASGELVGVMMREREIREFVERHELNIGSPARKLDRSHFREATMGADQRQMRLYLGSPGRPRRRSPMRLRWI